MTYPKSRTAVRTVATLATVFCANVATADVVINDDLVVIGGACIGFDCANGMPFGDDQLVLSENNSRIAFGAAGQFRLAANESSNGGASEFRIDAIQPTFVLTDQTASVNGGTYSLPGAVEPGDGTLVVTIDASTQTLLTLANQPPFTDATATLALGQTVILPAGSFTPVIGFSYSLVDGTLVTSTAPSGVFSAEVTNPAQSLIAFSEDGNMVTLGLNSEDVAGAVSVGSATVRRQVTGVADAVADDDVINFGQLTSALGSPALDLSEQIQSESSRLDGVSATTAAMSALQPNPRAQAPLSISLGLGTYEGETAGALGVLWRMSDTSHLQFSIAGSEETTPQTAVSFRIVW